MLHRKIMLFLGLTFFWLSAKSQSWCGQLSLSEEDRKNYQTLLKQATSSEKARRGANYEIYLKPKVIHSTQNTAAISTTQVFELVNKLNQVFAEINIQFIVEQNSVQHITDNDFYDLKTENDAQLRQKYDNNDAVNLYFTHTILRPDLSQLNGYTSLPNLSSGSNAIILSYLDNSFPQFSLLKEKIISHEFGHYFGLLHTYQDSNNEDWLKRELVTRGIGANCNNTGDLLCDTPADPFERASSIFALSCTEKLPADLLDFNGEAYSPPLDNYMSYQDKCGFKFTPMQYQTMEAGLNVRLSPSAEYTISKNLSNFLSVSNLDKTTYCKGEHIIVNYQKSGFFDPKNELKVEISNQNSENFREVINYEILSDQQIKIKTDASWEDGNNYRLIIKSTLPYSESPISNNFEIKSLPTVGISSSQKVVNSGDAVNLTITFGGSGPWSFKDWDGYSYNGITSNSVNFNVKVEQSKLFTISEISNPCGIIDQNPSVYVEALAASLQITSKGVFCNETLIKLPITGLKTNENDGYYQLQIKDYQQTINIIPNLLENAIEFYLPSEIQKDKTYDLKVLGKKLGEFSNTISFLVKTPPAQPSVVTPLHLCFGTKDYFLNANGQNLKWYNAENASEFTYSVLLNALQVSKKTYYVSQSDSNSCESPKSKLEVIVDEPVSGEISGNSNIFLGDSTFLNLTLTGSPPWNVTIDHLGDLTVNSAELKIAVNPLLSTEYRLSKVSNYCGSGTTTGSASVVVLTILGNPEEDKTTSRIYPNPVGDEFVNYVVPEDKVSEIRIINAEGKEVLSQKTNNASEGILNIGQLASGKYILILAGSKKSYYHYLIK
jgi:hypothetical protein